MTRMPDLTLYRRLLRLFPRPFRQRYGQLMEEALRADLERGMERRRRWDLALVWTRTLVDLGVSAAAERIATLLARRDPPFLLPRPKHAPMEVTDLFQDFLQDVRYGCRTLSRTPGFTAVAVVILALGIGANTALFTLVSRMFLEPPPAVGTPQELVRLSRYDADTPSYSWSYPDYEFFRDHNDTFSGVAAYDPGGEAVTVTLEPGRLSADAGYVTGNYFDVLEVPMAMGRGFGREESDKPGDGAVAVVSHGFWRRAFGASSDVLGTRVELNGHPFTVIGVAPRSFQGVSAVEEPPDVWIPITMQPVLTPGGYEMLERVAGLEMSWLQVLGRLRSGVSLDVAQANLDAVAASFGEELAAWAHEGQGVRLLSGFQFRPRVRGQIVGVVRLLAGVVGLVLLIAGANVAILLLARASARRRDLGVRLALGASRGRIIRQLLVECFLLALGGAAGGYLMAFWSADLMARTLSLNFAADFDPDLRVLGFTLIVAVLTAVLFGVAPALRASRSDLLALIQLGHPASGRSRLRNALVVAQVALSLVVVTGAALLVRSLGAAESVELGFETENRMLVTLNLNHHGYRDDAIPLFLDEALERVSAVPGVRRASAAHLAPFRGIFTTSFEVQGVESADGELTLFDTHANHVAPRFFETLGIPIVAGRDITDADRAGGAPVVVVNEALVKRVWPEGTNPIGQRLFLEDDVGSTVVGVVGDTRFRNLSGDTPPSAYTSLSQTPVGNVSILIESTADPALVRRSVEDAIFAVDPTIAFIRVQTLDDAAERVYGRYRRSAATVTLFGVLALVLAAVGLYGVLSYLVVQNTRALGIQMALGATGQRVARSVVSRGLGLAALGIVLGLAASWVAAKLIAGYLYGIDPRDPLSFVAVPAVLALVAFMASVVPAMRAAQVDPVEALREE